MYFTALAFIAAAFLYASVGFGGGSTYTAILIESGLHWELVPPVSLVCNLVVVSGGVYHFAKAGHLNLRFAAPLIVTSVPAAFLGGYLRLDESSLLQILGLALLVSGFLLLLDRQWRKAREFAPQTGTLISLGLGLLLGGLAGMTGIGGRHLPGADPAPHSSCRVKNGGGNLFAVHSGQFPGRTRRATREAW